MPFDTVPGGAGGAIRIARSFPEVLAVAHQRVARCDCGEEVSCYGCLRNFRNQSFHDELRRGDTARFLTPLTGLWPEGGRPPQCELGQLTYYQW